MSRIINGVVLGGAAAAAASYAVSPSFAPGALLWAANWGMVAGGLLGTSAACLRVAHHGRSYDSRQTGMMGTMAFGMIGTLASLFAGIVALETHDDEVYSTLNKAIDGIYGTDFSAAREGDTVPLRPTLMGGKPTPMVAKFAADPEPSLYGGSSGLQFRVCGQFNVAKAGTPDKVEYTYKICKDRPLTAQEIRRIIPSYK